MSLELESLVAQTLEELVRDAIWGLPTHAPPADAAGAYIDNPLTPQVWRDEVHELIYSYCSVKLVLQMHTHDVGSFARISGKR